MDMPLIGVIDDDLDILEMLSLLLPRLGYQVQTCSSVEQAQERLNAQTCQPDVLVLDLQIHGDDRAGFKLLQRLRTVPALAAVPAILSSANHITLGRLHAELAALHAVTLPKPYAFDQFQGAIARPWRSPSGIESAVFSLRKREKSNDERAEPEGAISPFAIYACDSC